MQKAERLCGCLMLAVIPLCAQETVRPEIHGVVMDPGINQGIPDAEITVYELPPGISRTEVAKISSDAQGAFRFAAKFGNYALQVKKAGYIGVDRNPAASMRANVALDREHPTHEVRFSLARSGELTGRVIDADTGHPMVKFPMMAVPFYYQNGQPRTFLPSFVSTDAEGRFRAFGLGPGRYLATFMPAFAGGGRVLWTFSEDEAKVIDQDYEASYWPGGGGLDVALPVQVPSGGFGDVGTIKLRKTPLYRVRLSIPASGCVPGRMVNVFLDTANLVEAACGRDYLVRNLPPGPHVFALYGNGEQNLRKHDSIPFDLKDENLHVTAAMHRGADLPGQVILAEGTKAFPFDRLQVRTNPAGSTPFFADESVPVKPDAEGKFALLNLSFGKRKLELIGLDTSYYVKEVRYNGAAISDNIFTLFGEGSLEIVLDDKPAVVSGVVSAGDRPASQPYVVLSKWPAPPTKMTGGEDGRFRFAGLPPGEYRIFAVSQADIEKVDEPGVLDRLMANGEKLSLTPRASQNVSLKLSDPAR